MTNTKTKMPNEFQSSCEKKGIEREEGMIIAGYSAAE
jgi:hypothetical protein